MSNAGAGKFYLAAVCPINNLSDKATTTVQTKPLDLVAAKADAAALRDSYRKAIETLSGENVLWPEAVKADVAALTELMYQDLSGADNVAKQDTDANLIAAWNGWVSPPSQSATAQKIRLKLALPPDTAGSCSTQ